jgi:TPR repeat protein
LVAPVRVRTSTAAPLRRFTGACIFVLALLPTSAHAASPSCDVPAATVSTKKNDVAHFEVTKSAALAASVPAQVELANLYRRGRGVSPDLTRAYAWLNVAAAKSTVAADQRDEVATCLDLNQRLEGQLLSVQLLIRVSAR